MIAPGKYRAKALTAELGFAKSGNEQVLVSFQITEPGPHQNHEIAWYGTVTENTAKRVIESLLLTGWDGVDYEYFTGLGTNEVSLVIEEEIDNQGKPRVRVKWINKIGGASLTNQMDRAQRTTFAARMRGVVAEVRGQNAKPAPRAPAASTGPRPTNGARPQGAQRWSATEGVRDDDMPSEVDDIPFISRGAW